MHPSTGHSNSHLGLWCSYRTYAWL